MSVSTHWVGGRWVEGDGERFAQRSPIDRSLIGEVVLAGADNAELALASASDALAAAAALSIDRRAAALRDLALALEGCGPEIAAQLTLENGVPSKQALPLQVLSAVALLRAMGDLVEAHSFEETRKALRGGIVKVVKLPVGVVAGISPWNVPIFLACIKLAPALAAGCPIVLKPPPQTAFSNHLLARCISSLDLPSGMINILTGDRLLGRTLVADRRVAKVSFTGGLQGGREVAAACAHRLARLTLELGGKSAALLLDDIDPQTVLPELLAATLQNNGQVCGAQSRLLIPRRRFDEIAGRFSQAVDGLQVDDPRLPNVDIGPVISDEQRTRITASIDQALARGAQILGERDREAVCRLPGSYVPPTVVTGVAPTDPIAQEEVFGPVVVLLPYEDVEEALRVANATSFGLAGSVWSSDPGRALAVARHMKAGTVAINSRRILDFGAPFGGIKLSGLGRELGPEGIDACLEACSILVPA